MRNLSVSDVLLGVLFSVHPKLAVLVADEVNGFTSDVLPIEERNAALLAVALEVHPAKVSNAMRKAGAPAFWEYEDFLKSIGAQTVREFSSCGPCLTQGWLVSRTAKTIRFWERPNGPVTVPAKPTGRGGWRLAQGSIHTEPCKSCMDHPTTNYPDGFRD